MFDLARFLGPFPFSPFPSFPPPGLFPLDLPRSLLRAVWPVGQRSHPQTAICVYFALVSFCFSFCLKKKVRERRRTFFVPHPAFYGSYSLSKVSLLFKKIPTSEGHHLCLCFLGEAHQPTSCILLKSFTKQALKLRQCFRLSVWEKSLQPPVMDPSSLTQPSAGSPANTLSFSPQPKLIALFKLLTERSIRLLRFKKTKSASSQQRWITSWALEAPSPLFAGLTATAEISADI